MIVGLLIREESMEGREGMEVVTTRISLGK